MLIFILLVLKNIEGTPKRILIPGWLFLYNWMWNPILPIALMSRYCAFLSSFWSLQVYTCCLSSILDEYLLTNKLHYCHSFVCHWSFNCLNFHLCLFNRLWAALLMIELAGFSQQCLKWKRLIPSESLFLKRLKLEQGQRILVARSCLVLSYILLACGFFSFDNNLYRVSQEKSLFVYLFILILHFIELDLENVA